MRTWLGHRDFCPSITGLPCDCPCSDDNCPGRDRCTATDCTLKVEEICRYCAAGLPDHCPQCGGCETSLSPKFCTCAEQHPITP